MELVLISSKSFVKHNQQVLWQRASGRCKSRILNGEISVWTPKLDYFKIVA